MTLYTVFYAVSKFIQLLDTAIFIYCILTWVAPVSGARRWLERFIEPFCAPFRPLAMAVCRRWGAPFDFTCLFAMIGLGIVERLLWVLFRLLMGIF